VFGELPPVTTGHCWGAVKQHFRGSRIQLMRKMVTDEKKRIDGRRYDEIRPITIETGVRAERTGSAPFTRAARRRPGGRDVGPVTTRQSSTLWAGEWSNASAPLPSPFYRRNKTSARSQPA
jgi:hypothetical protein